MSRWIVKSARYNYGQSGWFAYRAGEFDTTAIHFVYHKAAFRYAEAQAMYDRSPQYAEMWSNPRGWH